MKYDLTNQKFGLLTALYPLRKAGRAMWHCRCDCGQEYDATSYNLRKGITWHCGCQRRKDLTNKKFNSLTALYPAGHSGHGGPYWVCRCDCGNMIEVESSQLTTGNVRSCGSSQHRGKDISGERRGHLTAIRKTGKVDTYRNYIYEWQCDCGNVVERTLKLWMAQDASLMIMPGSVNLDEANIRDELTRYVGDEWNPIVDHEVDGRQSIPYQKDQSTQRFGRIMAARRVARTIMLGSAPSARSNAIKGIETSRIRLGVVQPGENIAIFNDALNTLQGALSYLYSNPTADRFWYDTRPTLRKTVEDRASQRSEEEVEMELERRLKQIRRERPFTRVHICPESSMDVSDDQEIGLVILKYSQVYRRNEPKDMAIQAATEILNTRGTAPRVYRNMLAFIAPDSSMMSALREEVKRFLAWKSIKEDAADLNLDNAQMRETESSLIRSSKTVDDRIQETYCHLLVPYIDREVDLKEIIWDEINIRGGTDFILVKASRKMQQNEQLITQWAPALLLMQLDNLLWREADEINIGELWKMLCTYCYLPRLAGFEVLQQAIQTGVNGDEYFAYAEGKADGKYFGLKYNQFIGMVDRSGFIVKQVAALKQLAAEREKRDIPVPPAPPLYPDDLDVIPPGPWTPPVTPPPMPEQPKNRHFGMTVTLDNTRVVRNVGNLMDEVINHLMNVDGAKVEIRLLVDAIMPDGTPAPVVRTVTENCRTLHVEDCGFDD